MNLCLFSMLLLTVIFSSIVLVNYKSELQVNTLSAVVLAFLHTIVGVFCVKAFAGLENLSNPIDAGMSLFGALFFLPFFYWAGSKITHRDMALIFDNFCLCVMIALMFVRCNCIVSGCCQGKVIPNTEMLWPTRQIEIIFWALVLGLFLYKKKQGYTKGIIYPLMLMLYGVFRFIIEFFRDEKSVLGFFHFGHIWAFLAFIIGSTIYFSIIEYRTICIQRKND